MNIYYEPPELLDEETGNYLEDKMSALTNLNLIHITHKFKYRLMWELRELEKEIDLEKGMIIIESKGIHTKDFSYELAEKIQEKLSVINWNVW